MKELTQAAQDFKSYLGRKIALDNALSLIFWDQSTGAPKGGAEARAKTVGILSGEAFSMSVSNEMKEHIDALSPFSNELDIQTAAMLRICKKDYLAMERIPKDEFVAYCELLSKAEIIWEEAKEKSDFNIFAPALDAIIKYLKTFIGYRGYKGHPYNTLLDDYEPGITVDELDLFFGEIRGAIVPLLKKITRVRGEKAACEKRPRDDFTRIPVSQSAQEAVSNLIMAELGFDFNRGMIRTSEHPFTNGMGRDDVRITTHYHEDAFLSSIYSTLHETGHAIYEQNTAPELTSTILDTGISMGIHESQSRFYENMIGRSEAFWEYMRDKITALLPDTLSDITPRDYYCACNAAEPSLIRINADELTYSLHIMIRYEIEKLIFSSDISVNDLPALWNEKYREYLGITPSNDAEGILQDVHWSGGSFGYFSSYSLGNAYAAQLLHYMNKEFDVNALVRKGDFKTIRAWLTDKIHKHGSIYLPGELIERIGGERLNARYYTDYLTEKFSGIYGL